MIITVAGNINIPITDRHKEIVNKYEITFNEDDTIQSVRAQLSNIRKQHRQLRRVYDTSNKNAVKSIHQTAAKIGGVIENLTFDDASSIWKAILSIEETNEEDVVIGRKYTILYFLLLSSGFQFNTSVVFNSTGDPLLLYP